MPEPSPRQPIRQARAAAKRAQILEAAEVLLIQDAPATLTTRAIAAQAGVPIGSVYRYFSDLDDLLTALLEQFNAGTLTAIRAIPDQPSSWRDEVRHILRIVEETHQRHPAYGPLILHFSSANGSDHVMARAVEERLLASRPGISNQQAGTMASTVMAIIDGVERWTLRLTDQEKPEAFEQGRRAVEAYLTPFLDGEGSHP